MQSATRSSLLTMLVLLNFRQNHLAISVRTIRWSFGQNFIVGCYYFVCKYFLMTKLRKGKYAVRASRREDKLIHRSISRELQSVHSGQSGRMNYAIAWIVFNDVIWIYWKEARKMKTSLIQTDTFEWDFESLSGRRVIAYTFSRKRNYAK